MAYHRLGKPDKGLVKRYLGKVAGLSNGHLYNLRQLHTYRSVRQVFARTRPTVMGEVTQYKHVGTVVAISEAFLIPVLEALIRAFPFAVQGFHAEQHLHPGVTFAQLDAVAHQVCDFKAAQALTQACNHLFGAISKHTAA